MLKQLLIFLKKSVFNHEMKKILVVGGGDYQVPLIKRIKDLGYLAFCVDKNDKAPGFSYADDHRCIDIIDSELCYEYAKELDIDGIATYGATITLPTVSYIGKRLNLKALPFETAKIAKNKYEIQKKIVEGGCNSKGPFFLYTDIHTAYHSDIKFPCVAKPCDGSGSKGVSIVFSQEQYNAALEKAFCAARFGEIYVERYIEGDEYSVEAFVDNRKVYIYAIVKTTFIRHGSFNTDIEYGHCTPADINDDQEQNIVNEVEKAIRVLDINMGSVNFDIILSSEDNKAYIIDCGIRVGQNLISSHIIPLSRGVNEMDLYISQVLNMATNPRPKYQKCIATRLLIPNPGKIVHFGNSNQYVNQYSIVDIVFKKKAGDLQGKYKNKSDNCGWVICSGNTSQEAEENAETARKAVLSQMIIEG